MDWDRNQAGALLEVERGKDEAKGKTRPHAAMSTFIYGVIKSGKPFDVKRAMPMLDIQDGI